MGNLHAQEFAGLVKTNKVDIDIMLLWHLTGNHYPPVHRVFIPIAKKAIEKANEGNWEEIIQMPNGKALSVAKIIEELHLDSFLDSFS